MGRGPKDCLQRTEQAQGLSWMYVGRYTSHTVFICLLFKCSILLWFIFMLLHVHVHKYLFNSSSVAQWRLWKILSELTHQGYKCVMWVKGFIQLKENSGWLQVGSHFCSLPIICTDSDQCTHYFKSKVIQKVGLQTIYIEKFGYWYYCFSSFWSSLTNLWAY